MDFQKTLRTEFDAERRLLLVSYEDRVEILDPEQLREVFEELHKRLEEHSGRERIYLIIDMNNLVIDPALADQYIEHAMQVSERYVHPNGIARFGYQITRVTVRRGYQEKSNQSPNIFGSRDEAEAYINSLIEEKNQAIVAGQAGMVRRA